MNRFFIIQLKLSVQNAVITENQALKILDDRLKIMEYMESDVQKDDATWDDKKSNKEGENAIKETGAPNNRDYGSLTFSLSWRPRI